MRVGIAATGPLRWCERLLTELGHELWIGDSAKISAGEVRTGMRDPQQLEAVACLGTKGRPPRRRHPSRKT